MPAIAPPVRTNYSLAFDSERSRIVLFGGNDSSNYLSDTWELPSNRPPALSARYSPASPSTATPITLAAGFSDPDGDSPSFRWLQTFGPRVTLNNATSAVATFSTTIATSYGFQVVAADGHEGYAYALATLTVAGGAAPNSPPTAYAGPARTSNLNSATTLAGSASDPDGDPLSFSWSVASGPNGGLLSGSSTLSPSFTPTAAGTYTLRLTVNDGRGHIVTADTSVTGNTVPVALPGASRTVVEGALVTLDGSASTDADGNSLSYSWSQLSGATVSLSGASTTRASFTAPSTGGSFTFRLTVSDGRGGSSSASVTITVDRRPSVSASATPAPLNIGQPVQLSATASDPDGDPLAYAWSQSSGPVSVSLSGATARVASFLPASAGSYGFSVRVNDGRGGEATAPVSLRVNAPPVVSAPNRNATIGLPLQLTATASDADSDTLSYSWVQRSGPATLALAGASTLSVSFTPSVLGTYVLRVTVSDGKGASAFSDSTVTVASSGTSNQPPTAFAGADRSVSIGSPVTLSGTASDPDNDPISYAWAQTSGPAVSLAGASTASASFTPATTGVLVFRLTASDGLGGSGTSFVTVTVLPAQNRPPVVSASTPSATVSTGSFAALVATASDADGDPLEYSWSQLSGPETVLTSSSSARASAFLAASGSYAFRVRVSDGRGGDGSDDVSVTAVDTSNGGLVLTFSPRLDNGGPPPATVGQPYTLTFLASGGSGTYFFAVAPGSALPPGLGLDKNGLLSGTPAAARLSGFQFAVQVSDTVSQLARNLPLTLIVNPPPLPESPHPYRPRDRRTYRYSSPAAPAPIALDLVFDASTAFEPGADFLHIRDGLGKPIAGSPFTGLQLAGRTVRVPGSSVTLELVPDASDPPGVTFDGFRLRAIRDVLPSDPNKLRIVTSVAPAGRVNSSYRLQLEAEGGVPPLEWGLFGQSALPAGLALLPSGLLVGVPSTPLATTAIPIAVRDRSTPQRQVDTIDLALAIKPAFGPRLRRARLAAAGGNLPLELRLENATGSSPIAEALAVLSFDGRFLQAGNDTALAGPAAAGAFFPPPFLVGDGARAYLLLGRMGADGTLVSDSFRARQPLPASEPELERLVTLTFARLQDTTGEVSFLLPPTADAGFDQRVLLDDAGRVSAPDPLAAHTAASRRRPWVTLDGRKSVDCQGRALSYLWRQEDGRAVTLSGAASPVATFVPPAPGVYVFSLTVVNSGGVAGVPALTRVRAETGRQREPVASIRVRNARTSEETLDAVVGDTVQLDGTASRAADPLAGSFLSYRWQADLSGTTAPGAGLRFSPSDSAPRVLFALSAAGEYRFSLTVTDPEGLSSPDVSVRVRARPAGGSRPGLRLVAISGSDATTSTETGELEVGPAQPRLRLEPLSPITVKPEGFTAGDGNRVVYTWRTEGGPSAEISDPTSSSPVIRPTTAGVHNLVVQAREVDSSNRSTGAVTSAQLEFVVETAEARVPAASAIARAGQAQGPRVSAPAGASVALVSLTTEPDVSLTWRQTGGPSVDLSDPTSAVATFSVPDLRDGTAHELLFEHFADRGRLRSLAARVSVTVQPAATSPLTIHLEPGLNCIALPSEPAMPGRPALGSDLAALAGASFIARVAPRPGERGRFAISSGGPRGDFLTQADEGYILNRIGPAVDLRLTGRRWQQAGGSLLALRAGLNLAAMPRGVSRQIHSSEMLELTGAVFVARPRPGKGFDIDFAGGGGPGFLLEPGKAYIVSSPASRTVAIQ